MNLSIKANPVRIGDAKPTGLMQAAGLPKEKVMQANKFNKIFSLLMGSVAAVGLTVAVGCGSESPGSKGDDASYEPIEINEEGEPILAKDVGAEALENRTKEWVNIGSDLEGPEDKERLDYLIPDEDAPMPDGEEEEEAEEQDDKPELKKLEDLELLNPMMGSQFGDAILSEEEARFEIFEKGDLVIIQFQNSDEKEQHSVEIDSQVADEIFNAPANALVQGSEAIADYREDALEASAVSFFGESPEGLENELEAVNVTVAIFESELLDALTVLLTLESEDPNTGVQVKAYGQFDIPQSK